MFRKMTHHDLIILKKKTVKHKFDRCYNMYFFEFIYLFGLMCVLTAVGVHVQFVKK